MDNKIKDEQIRGGYVDGAEELNDVPKQNVVADERHIAEEKTGKHENRGDDAHDAAVRELLKRVEFLAGRRPERILLTPEDRPEVKSRLAEDPSDIPSPQCILAAQMTACKTVDEPEDTGGRQRPACVPMDEERGAVGRQVGNSRHAKPDAGYKEQRGDEGVGPVLRPERQGVEIDPFHRFTMARTAPWTSAASATTGRKTAPSRSTRLALFL